MSENMQDRGARMGEEAGSIADKATGAVSEMAGRLRDSAGQYAGQAKEYAQQGYRYASDKAGVLKSNTENYITENPWYAIGIALGVGLLLGMVIRGGGSSDD